MQKRCYGCKQPVGKRYVRVLLKATGLPRTYWHENCINRDEELAHHPTNKLVDETLQDTPLREARKTIFEAYTGK